MMDRFKFRAWDKENKIMHERIEACYDVNILDKCTGLENHFTDYFSKDLENDKKYFVMQCLGLKDRNGKLVYERDIIKNIFSNNLIYIVYWDIEKAKFKFVVQNGDCNSIFTSLEADKKVFEKKIEVLGNIYENNKLLKEKCY